MKVLNISLDKNLFVAGSEARQRHIEYGQLFDELHILALCPGQEQKINKNVWIYSVSGNKIKRFLSANKKAKEIIKQNKIDVISAQDPFFTGLIGWRLKKKFQIPFQIQIHTDFLSPYFWQESFLNKIRVWLAKFVIPKADGIRVVSQRIKQSIISQYPPAPEQARYGASNIPISKIIVLPIFVDVKKIQEASIRTNLHQKYPQFDFIILTASRLTREKNIGLAIEAMKEIIEKFPKTGLIIVGEGPEKNSLKLKTINYKLETNVVFEPWTDDLISYYKIADLFLLTSNYEGYGRTVIEAMAAGCLVVMTDVGLAGEILINGHTGIVIPVADKESLVKEIELLLTNKERTNTFVNESQKIVNSLLKKEQYLDLYRESFQT